MSWSLVEPFDVPALARKVESWGAVVVDVETEGVELWYGDRTLYLGLGPLNGDDEYSIQVRLIDPSTFAVGDIISTIQPLMEVLSRKPLIGWNVKFDLHGMAQLPGFDPIQEAFFDAIVMGLNCV